MGSHAYGEADGGTPVLENTDLSWRLTPTLHYPSELGQVTLSL